jgi:hypothetical protein
MAEVIHDIAFPSQNHFPAWALQHHQNRNALVAFGLEIGPRRAHGSAQLPRAGHGVDCVQAFQAQDFQKGIVFGCVGGENRGQRKKSILFVLSVQLKCHLPGSVWALMDRLARNFGA